MPKRTIELQPIQWRTVAALADRWNGGESLQSLADDYAVPVEQVQWGIALAQEAEAGERAEAQTNALRDFAQKIVSDEPGDVDGFTVQEAALECGLLKAVEVTAPCSESSCACAEWGGFPMMCNRRTELLDGKA